MLRTKKTFKRGWYKVPIGLMGELKMQLWEILGINHSMSWNRRLAGINCRSLSPIEEKAIEELFRKYNITDIWDED